MGTIIWHNPAQGVQEFILKPGVNTVGRIEENDICIPDDSVSSHHGEFVFENGQIVFRDLGSTNGSYVNGQPVQEITLAPAQAFRLGGIDLSVKRTAVAHPLPQASNILVEPDPLNGSFYSQIGSSFTYPVRQGGLFLLVCGTIFFAMLDFAAKIFSFSSGFFFLWPMLTAASGIYMFAFMQSVITITSNGDRNRLSWLDSSSFDEGLFMPFLRFIAIWTFYLAPGLVGIFIEQPWFAIALLLMGVMPDLISGYDLGLPMVGLALSFMGLVCVPMAVLTVTLANSIRGLNPIVVLASIAKVPGQYTVTCLLFLVVLITSSGLDWILRMTGIPILPALIGYFISHFIFLYGLTVLMRLLGMLYRYNEKKFNWF